MNCILKGSVKKLEGNSNANGKEGKMNCQIKLIISIEMDVQMNWKGTMNGLERNYEYNGNRLES